jgi:prevent-host-death family protein
MVREAPAMTVRQNLGELLNEVQYRHDRVVITKAGKPVAALVDIALFERINKLDSEFARMADELAAAFKPIPEQEGAALLDEAIRSTRRKPTADK